MLVFHERLQKRIVTDRLLAEDQRLQQSFFVDQAATCAVDQARARFHQRQFALSDQAACSVRSAGQ